MFRHHATASLPEEAMVTGGRALIGDVSSMIEANHFVPDRGLLLPVDAIEGLLRRVDGSWRRLKACGPKSRRAIGTPSCSRFLGSINLVLSR